MRLEIRKLERISPKSCCTHCARGAARCWYFFKYFLSRRYNLLIDKTRSQEREQYRERAMNLMGA